MPRVLLVTSTYAPAMIADMHRVRHLAWDLPAAGWEVEVLHPGLGFQRSEYVDRDSAELFNPATPVTAVSPVAPRLFRLLRMGTIAWRAFFPLRQAGDRLLRSGRFHLVYISTANFLLFCLGPGWAARHGVPYVLDFHDPWIRAESKHRTVRAGLKPRLNRVLAGSLERTAVCAATGIVSVSPGYLAELTLRHPEAPALARGRAAVIPFAGSARDLAAGGAVKGARERLGEAARLVVYVGAGGSIMEEAFDAICRSLRRIAAEKRDLLAGLVIHLEGTHSLWRPGDPAPFAERAAAVGLGAYVREAPGRISYLESLAAAVAGDGLLVLGVDDPAYMPSKLFSYALTGKPLLASFHVNSMALRYFDEMPGLGRLVRFGEGADEEQNLQAVTRFVTEVRQKAHFDRSALLEPWLSKGMATKHAKFFDQVVRETAS